MEKNETSYRDLKQELKLVSSVAPKGAHKKVRDAVGISSNYSQQIRHGEGAKFETPESRKMITDMITEYRKHIEAYKSKLAMI